METSSKTTVELGEQVVNFQLNLGCVLYGKQNGADLGDLEKGPISTMFVSPESLGKTVWRVYEDRLTAVGISKPETLYELMTGSKNREIDLVMKAVISDFFPWGPAVIQAIGKKLGAIAEVVEKMDQTTEQSGQLSGEPPASLETSQQS